MAQPSAIDIVLDHRQLRRWKDPILWHVNGLDWDHDLSEDVYHDSETGNVFLRPTCYYPTWLTSNSGLYAKYRLADYTLTTSAKWKEMTANGAGNYFLFSQDVNESVTTSAVVGAVNQAMMIGWFVYGDGAYAGQSDDGTRLECGWGVPGTSECYLKIYPSGRIKVYRVNTLIGEHDLWSPEQRKGATSATKTGGQGQAQVKSFQVFLLRPMVGGLLVTCSQTGRSAYFRFPDLDLDSVGASSEVIVSNTYFWWWVRNPTGATTNVQADVQLAKLQCAASGVLYSEIVYLTEAPGTDRGVIPTETIFTNGLTITPTLVKSESPFLPFEPDKDAKFRVKVTLAGTYANGSLACVQGGWKGYPTWTDSSEQIRLPIADPDMPVTDATITVPDEIGGATFACSLLYPDKLDELQGASLARTQSNRPLLVRFGSGDENPIINGRTNAPTWEDHWNDEAIPLELSATDQWKAFLNFRFASRWVLAGYSFKDALQLFVDVTGAFEAGDIEIEDVPDFDLPSLGIQADDSMKPMIQVGDTAADWVKRLNEDYAPLDFCRIVPRAGGVKFKFRRLYE